MNLIKYKIGAVALFACLALGGKAEAIRLSGRLSSEDFERVHSAIWIANQLPHLTENLNGLRSAVGHSIREKAKILSNSLSGFDWGLEVLSTSNEEQGNRFFQAREELGEFRDAIKRIQDAPINHLNPSPLNQAVDNALRVIQTYNEEIQERLAQYLHDNDEDGEAEATPGVQALVRLTVFFSGDQNSQGLDPLARFLANQEQGQDQEVAERFINTCINELTTDLRRNEQLVEVFRTYIIPRHREFAEILKHENLLRAAQEQEEELPDLPEALAQLRQTLQEYEVINSFPKDENGNFILNEFAYYEKTLSEIESFSGAISMLMRYLKPVIEEVDAKLQERNELEERQQRERQLVREALVAATANFEVRAQRAHQLYEEQVGMLTRAMQELERREGLANQQAAEALRLRLQNAQGGQQAATEFLGFLQRTGAQGLQFVSTLVRQRGFGTPANRNTVIAQLERTIHRFLEQQPQAAAAAPADAPRPLPEQQRQLVVVHPADAAPADAAPDNGNQQEVIVAEEEA